MLKSYLIAILGISMLMLAWSLVQNAWRTMFGTSHPDGDVLAGRTRCTACVCKNRGTCTNRPILKDSDKESRS